MTIDIITSVPKIFESFLSFGPVRKAMENSSLVIRFLNVVDFAKHPKEIDDYPYAGVSGMVMKIEPIYKAIMSAKENFDESYVILLSPQGKVLNQEKVKELVSKKHLILICGRYKGIDARVENFIDEEISIGDYILSGGEIAAIVLVDAISRLLPNAVNDPLSVLTDSFEDGLLDAPYYTRPYEFMGYVVPEVLLSGDHKKIEDWINTEKLRITVQKRPDLIKKLVFKLTT
ncbi:MAG: tRNA (guanosine(37)-N1)-methyltransferase TrmD [candidate division WOR-3 bacterium]|nr:tRNA (guanosine(37)-N1)-methyltransferase TrmD [candidate division WOR-3 bacterium]MCX7948170.1 tRNA (guanosine(37)-N1)-methyltransferase TrmD [candidate division WOR-3 bacterium]MDW8151134.1 tRNA (guanosine(37)-N1)-methyltransferase TrmD [candidate division WOR-3 bacterium]